MFSIREFSRAADQTGEIQDDLQITALHRAAYRGDIEDVKTLLRKGVEVNVTDVYGWTPLHDAALKGELEIATLLIQAGALTHLVDKEHLTPLACALKYAQKEAAAILQRA